MLLPLLLSTSAALYRGASKAAAARDEGAKEDGGREGSGVGAGLVRALSFLPKGIWVGIGIVWCYWIFSAQLGLF